MKSLALRLGFKKMLQHIVFSTKIVVGRIVQLPESSRVTSWPGVMQLKNGFEIDYL